MFCLAKQWLASSSQSSSPLTRPLPKLLGSFSPNGESGFEPSPRQYGLRGSLTRGESNIFHSK